MKIRLLKEMVGKALNENNLIQQLYNNATSGKVSSAEFKEANEWWRSLSINEMKKFYNDLILKNKSHGKDYDYENDKYGFTNSGWKNASKFDIYVIWTLNKKTNESNLREVSDFKIDGTSLKQYQSRYPNFKFSTDVDTQGNKQLVVDVPKRKQEIKFYVWNGKINAQVTNGGLSNYATLDDALDHLYRQYGTTAPSYKQSDKIAKFNNKK